MKIDSNFSFGCGNGYHDGFGAGCGRSPGGGSIFTIGVGSGDFMRSGSCKKIGVGSGCGVNTGFAKIAFEAKYNDECIGSGSGVENVCREKGCCHLSSD